MSFSVLFVTVLIFVGTMVCLGLWVINRPSRPDGRGWSEEDGSFVFISKDNESALVRLEVRL